jgi:LysM repeat protein
VVVLRCLLVGTVSVGGALAVGHTAVASSVAPAATHGGRAAGAVEDVLPITLSDTQLHWARRIIAAVKTHPGFSSEDERERAADIALMTALTESGLQMYANSNNPESLKLPHDRVGSDHGSVGLFQQQVGGAINSTANWGTTAQCMDVQYATRRFLDRLTAFDWTSYTNWAAAQKVQGSFDPTGGNYRRNDSLAVATRKMLWGGTPGGATATAPPEPAATPAPKPIRKPSLHDPIATYRVRRGDNLTHIAARHGRRHVTIASLAELNRLDDPNLIYAGQLLRIG